MIRYCYRSTDTELIPILRAHGRLHWLRPGLNLAGQARFKGGRTGPGWVETLWMLAAGSTVFYPCGQASPGSWDPLNPAAASVQDLAVHFGVSPSEIRRFRSESFRSGPERQAAQAARAGKQFAGATPQRPGVREPFIGPVNG